MKTLEERAEEWATFNHTRVAFDTRLRKEGYIQGATEQKAIDDIRIAELESFVERATLMMEMEKAKREHLESVNKGLIDEACEWLMKFYAEDDMDMVSASAFINDFRKAMEDK